MPFHQRSPFSYGRSWPSHETTLRTRWRCRIGSESPSYKRTQPVHGEQSAEQPEFAFESFISSQADMQSYQNYLKNRGWWPAENHTSLALAAWKSWARLSKEKLSWLLEFVKKGQNSPCGQNEVDYCFRSQHVPSRVRSRNNHRSFAKIYYKEPTYAEKRCLRPMVL